MRGELNLARSMLLDALLAVRQPWQSSVAFLKAVALGAPRSHALPAAWCG